MEQNMNEKSPDSFSVARFVRKLIHHVGNILRWLYLTYLRLAGVNIGSDCMISLRAKIDARRGRVVIGDRCTITYGCVILSHDASARHINPEDDGAGQVIIEDDVYVGVNSVILRNVKIGKNSVIGAGSIVTKDIPPNVVAVGNPAIVIKEIDRFKLK
jgi:acetyltransferase-like isoleucine patch superfamily enzyme